MAIITVKGTITRVFYENKGVEITEFYKSANGEQKQRKFTGWFDTPQRIVQGQTGEIKGQLAVAIDEWKNADGSPKLDQSGKPGKSVKVTINGSSFTPDNNSQQLVDDSLPF